MGSLSVILIVALTTKYGFSYVLEPSLSWPEEYNFGAEKIDMFSGVVKPFEIWYSEKFNKSRIDLYGGTVKRIYYGPEYDSDDSDISGKAFMYHPESDENENPVMLCEQMTHWSDQENFLPELEDFVYSKHEQHGGKKLSVWTKTHSLGTYFEKQETLYVEEKEADIGIPVQHVTKKYNSDNGALTTHTIVNYFNYNSNVKEEDVQADEDKCVEFDPYDFDKSIKLFHPDISNDVESAFLSYKKHHKRVYKEKEHEYRKAIFHQNWKLVVEHNSKKLGSTLAVNKYADRTPHELRYLTATKFSEPIRGTQSFPYTGKILESIADKLPEEYDLRTEGIISPVRNQANCGSCWAFAATATVEGAVARSNGGHIMDLSEQSLVDCAWQYQSHGCEGTESIDAVYGYLVKHGIPTVQEYGPYLEEDGLCNINNMTEPYRIRGYVAVTPLSQNALKAAIYRNGPVTIGVLVTPKMMLYNNGVFFDYDCQGMPAERMNHAVVAVGYGVRDGDLFWIVKNSWGEDWGDDGYIKISAKDNNCNIMSSPVYPVM